MLAKRLKHYFYEADIHIGKIQRAKKVLKEVMPLKSLKLEEKYLDKLDILAFRFAKLQDLLGEKIFRNILEYSGYPVDGKRFVEILAELEKEKFLDVDSWIELRKYRNFLAHEYPHEEELRIEAINFIFENSDYLTEITKKLEKYYHEIESSGN
ncbi:hypothetical protein [Nitratiruptor sp. SB155-2]|uniref:hypothetical protein n=1 Tax=Nitratiruptor sp. (strain SB155-2) TaxID=387092 RepID=UPI0001587222|nr:hypothetical protein [Nitratiruptor sp. SB155-2]BAF70377.1 conserved hypothetical protein [Nitratiruptor sp. SB155-2]